MLHYLNITHHMVFMSFFNNNVYKYIYVWLFDFCTHKMYSWIQDNTFFISIIWKIRNVFLCLCLLQTELWLFHFIPSLIFLICSSHIHFITYKTTLYNKNVVVFLNWMKWLQFYGIVKQKINIVSFRDLLFQYVLYLDICIKSFYKINMVCSLFLYNGNSFYSCHFWTCWNAILYI